MIMVIITNNIPHLLPQHGHQIKVPDVTTWTRAKGDSKHRLEKGILST